MTPTGRTPSGPNFQNIPIRTEVVRRIRQSFVQPQNDNQPADQATYLELLRSGQMPVEDYIALCRLKGWSIA